MNFTREDGISELRVPPMPTGRGADEIWCRAPFQIVPRLAPTGRAARDIFQSCENYVFFKNMDWMDHCGDPTFSIQTRFGPLPDDAVRRAGSAAAGQSIFLEVRSNDAALFLPGVQERPLLLTEPSNSSRAVNGARDTSASIEYGFADNSRSSWTRDLFG
jgi:hypothetical protein